MEPKVYTSEKEKFILLIFEIEENQDIKEIISSAYYMKTEEVLPEIPLDHYFKKYKNNGNLFKLIAKVNKNQFELIREYFSVIKTFSELKETNYKIEFKEYKKYFIFQRNN